jgi:hypothetical protein
MQKGGKSMRGKQKGTWNKEVDGSRKERGVAEVYRKGKKLWKRNFRKNENKEKYRAILIKGKEYEKKFTTKRERRRGRKVEERKEK